MGYVLFMFMHRAHACECACASARVIKHSLIFGRIQICWPYTTNDHKLHGLYTYHVHAPRACVRACVCEHVIKHSLIYGRILFKFAVNRLQITTSSIGCILVMFTHRVHACDRVRLRVRVRVVQRSLIFGRIVFKFAGNILQITTRSICYILFMTRVCDCMS
jgi:hypothetical protein